MLICQYLQTCNNATVDKYYCQLGCNNDCYDKAGRNSCNDAAGLNSCYNEAGCNSCYDEGGRIGILLRILRLAQLNRVQLGSSRTIN